MSSLPTLSAVLAQAPPAAPSGAGLVNQSNLVGLLLLACLLAAMFVGLVLLSKAHKVQMADAAKTLVISGMAFLVIAIGAGATFTGVGNKIREFLGL
jgi:hypothetical protein